MKRHLALASLLCVACRNPRPASPDAPAAQRGAVDATVDAAVDVGGEVAVPFVVLPPEIPGDVPPSYVIQMLDGSAPGLAHPVDAGPPTPTNPFPERALWARNREPPAPPPALSLLTATVMGGAWVRALAHEGRPASRVVVTALSLDGQVSRRERQVAVTADPIVSLSAHAAGGHMWLSWITRREGADHAEELQSFAMHMKADVMGADAPIALETFRVEPAPDDHPANAWWARPATQAIARDDGGGLIVATGRSGPCSTQRAPRMPFARVERCAMWTEFRFGPRVTRRTFTRPLIGPVGVPTGFTTVPNGALYAISARRETVRSAAVEAPYQLPVDGAQPRVHESVYFQRDLSFAWDGEGVVALGRPANGPLGAPRSVARFDAQANALTPLRVNAQRQTEWAPVSVAPLSCVDGHAVVRVRWASGEVVLDPTVATQHFDLFAWANASGLPLPEATDGGAPTQPRVTGLVWTGRALAGLVDGAIHRWTCTPAGALALEPPSTFVAN